MTTHNPKFRGTPGPWRVDGHVGRNDIVNYSIVSISGNAVGCAAVRETASDDIYWMAIAAMVESVNKTDGFECRVVFWFDN